MHRQLSLNRFPRLFLLFGYLLTILFGMLVLVDAPLTGAQTTADYGVANIDDIEPAIKSVEWLDAATIVVTFKNNKIITFGPGGVKDNGTSSLRDERLSSEPDYGVMYKPIDGYPCEAEVRFDIDELKNSFEKQSTTLAEGNMFIELRPNADSDCTGGNDFDIDLVNPDKSIAWFKWTTDSTISTADGQFPGSFTKGTSPPVNIDSRLWDIYTSDREKGATTCQDKLIVHVPTNTMRWYQLGDSNGVAPTGIGTECKYNDDNDDESFPRNNFDWQLANTAATASAVTDGLGSSASSVAGDASCEANGGTFSFIICPVLTQADGAIATLDGRIFEALIVGESNYDDPEGNLRESWARIRNVGYLLLIPIMLIMVISTALGFSFVDAYTVKRALPRMFAAIIFMALSFDLCIIAIEIVNGVGKGAAGLITQPFGGLENLQLRDIFNPDAANNGTALVIAIGVIFKVAGSVGIGIIASYLFVAALFLLIIFIMLALRRVLVVALILLAPLAILSWIFPGNDKLWKLWYNSFTKLLYLFPIIIALLATGRVFASIVSNVEDGLFGTILKLTAFIGPYFLIPTAFKFAGGAFGNIAGMANDRGKGLFDRQRKYRQKSAAENKQKSENFSRFSDNNMIGRGANTVLGSTRGKNMAKIAKKPGDISGGIKRAQATGQTIQGMEDMKNDYTYQANQNDDNFLVALANRELAEKNLAADRMKLTSNEKIQNDTTGKFTQADKDAAVIAANGNRASIHAKENGLAAAGQVKGNKSKGVQRQAFNAWMKSGYSISDGEEGYNEISQTADNIAGIQRAADGRITSGDLRARSALMDEAQYHAKSAGNVHLGGINHGNGYDPIGGIKKVGLYQLAGGKTASIDAWGQDVMANGDDKQKAIHLAELKSMQPNTNGANKKAVNQQIAALESDKVLQLSMRTSSGNIDTVTGAQKQVFEQYNSARANADSSYRARFTTAEQAGGGRMRNETMGEAAKQVARAYEAIDPNKVD
jgi:hypothetical protein